MSKILPIFNKHFLEFLDDISSVFPDNVDIITAKNGILAIKKINPTIIVKIWQKHIVEPYLTQIQGGNIDFFIHKDYTTDLATTDNSDKILESINRLRDPIRQMSLEDQKKSMKYIQNLTKLSICFHES